jgi:hypothetical protein
MFQTAVGVSASEHESGRPGIIPGVAELVPTPADPPTAAERLALAVGRSAPSPLSESELRAFEAAQDRADTEALRIYGRRGRAAA